MDPSGATGDAAVSMPVSLGGPSPALSGYMDQSPAARVSLKRRDDHHDQHAEIRPTKRTASLVPGSAKSASWAPSPGDSNDNDGQACSAAEGSTGGVFLASPWPGRAGDPALDSSSHHGAGSAQPHHDTPNNHHPPPFASQRDFLWRNGVGSDLSSGHTLNSVNSVNRNGDLNGLAIHSRDRRPEPQAEGNSAPSSQLAQDVQNIRASDTISGDSGPVDQQRSSASGLDLPSYPSQVFAQRWRPDIASYQSYTDEAPHSHINMNGQSLAIDHAVLSGFSGITSNHRPHASGIPTTHGEPAGPLHNFMSSPMYINTAGRDVTSAVSPGSIPSQGDSSTRRPSTLDGLTPASDATLHQLFSNGSGEYASPQVGVPTHGHYPFSGPPNADRYGLALDSDLSMPSVTATALPNPHFGSTGHEDPHAHRRLIARQATKMGLPAGQRQYPTPEPSTPRDTHANGPSAAPRRDSIQSPLSKHTGDPPTEGDEERRRGSLESLAQEDRYAPVQKKVRGAFSEDARRETGDTRKRGACIRCRIQRARCIPNPSDPDGECKTCNAVQKDSKKVVHRLPCLRWKFTEIVLSRTDVGNGSLNLTNRWRGFDMKDIDDADWASSDTRLVQMSLDVFGDGFGPINISVREFRPRDGDVTCRVWRDNEVVKHAELAPYALANVRQAAKDFKTHVNNHTLEALKAVADDENVDDTIRETYKWAIRHYHRLRVPGLADNQQTDEWQFLADVYRLWMAIRHTVGSSFLCGDDKLGMEPYFSDQSYPLWSRVSTPRMIIAQADSILASEIISPLRKKVLRQLEGMIKANKPKHWSTIYLSVFLLLHNVSVISADRRRHGKDNGAPKGYSLPGFVAELQKSANILLAYWHYYRTDNDPVKVGCMDRHRTRLMDLTAEKFTFIQKSCVKMRQSRELFNTVVENNFDHEVYWVCRMFDHQWSASETFKD